MTLVIATNNPGKFKEIVALLQGLDVRLLPLDRIELPPESGDSFQENACIKATAVARETGCLALADDSGLEVDALGGEPGVLSARYGGPTATDADRNRMILERLRGVPRERRAARFRCVIAIADPQGQVKVAQGVFEGRIAEESRGSSGFGYDPIFEIPSFGKTVAEVAPEVKNRLSHRAKAMACVRTILGDILAKDI
ncbi:MAG: RdgB/HAM1 family non-canonical purine NTP pyrophosphatase [Deltaproteobacteria bacterium]|nr:RdgB/HAM1 family non-canonical purine NTP pyrophosphatase [Deltaproteobacteria bacterium]